MATTDKPDAVDPRILFAAERTLFAYVRTGLALMGFGFVVARFGLFLRQIALVSGQPLPSVRQNTLSEVTGIVLILCGVVLCVYAPLWYRATVIRLQRGEAYTPPVFPVASMVAVFVGGVGVFLAWYLYLLR